jgi:AcrR family transcriptional regulator
VSGDRTRVQLRAPERERRSQAERTAETRARIIGAVVESIGEVGLARTTATEITRRAGVTWGAVQHHFGDKDGILLAVLEHSFDGFVERLGDVAEDASMEKRAARFVDRAWDHFSSPLYRSSFEILLDYSSRPREDGVPTWQTRMFEAWDRVWQRIFSDSVLPRRRRFMLQHYTISTLSGLASTLMLEGGEASLRAAELDFLKETLARALTRPGASG